MRRGVLRSVARYARTIRAGVLGAAAIACGAGAGCFIDPINRAPTIVSITPTGGVKKNQRASFKIAVYDPDSDDLKVSWAVETISCPTRTDPRLPPSARTDGDTVDVDMDMTGSRFCIWAFARDRYGAEAVYYQNVDPENKPPEPRISIVAAEGPEPYRLYRPIVLTSDGSSDPENDHVTFTWTLTRSPSGSAAVLQSTGCDPEGELSASDLHCFTPDQPAQGDEYEVELTATEDVSDGNIPTMQGTARRSFKVATDHPPCIETDKAMPALLDSVRPLLGSATDTEIFSVEVDDDGDPYPPPEDAPSKASFTWYLTGPDGNLLVRDWNINRLPVTLGGFPLGDAVKVRVEVHDRNRAAVDQILRDCGDRDLCGTSACPQRVTWNLRWIGGG